ncbi:putative 3-dehydrosphinganine reductase [Helianthus debilis subsp. tardiflorus]
MHVPLPFLYYISTLLMACTNLSFLALCVLPTFILIIFLKLLLRPHPIKIPIESRHVFITGGSSSISLALARRAAAEGAPFGLRGLAEALQQEVIADDIHISLIFPPERNTPGLAKGSTPRSLHVSIL